MSMSDDAPDLGDFVDSNGQPLRQAQTTISNAELRVLRKKANQAEELQGRIADLERRETFSLAGIPLDHPAAEYLVKGYQGELTPEAIRAEAVRLKIIESAAPTAAEQAGHNAAAAAAAGGVPPGTLPDVGAQLATLGQKTFSATDEVGMQAHMAEIARVARDNNLRIPIQ